MTDRPTQGIQSTNRIQFETTPEGKKVFREYWVNEWDGKGYQLSEHIKDLDQAIKRSKELGYRDNAKKLEQFRQDGN